MSEAASDLQIAAKAREFCATLRDYGYTRKADDKQRMLLVQQELLTLCPDTIVRVGAEDSR